MGLTFYKKWTFLIPKERGNKSKNKNLKIEDRACHTFSCMRRFSLFSWSFSSHYWSWRLCQQLALAHNWHLEITPLGKRPQRTSGAKNCRKRRCLVARCPCIALHSHPSRPISQQSVSVLKGPGEGINCCEFFSLFKSLAKLTLNTARVLNL